MAFDGATDTDVLRMTQAGAPAIIPGGGSVAAQEATANGVNGRIRLLPATSIAAGATITCELKNTKIGADSVVLYTLNVSGTTGPNEPIVVQGRGNPTTGSYTFNITNVGPNPYATVSGVGIEINYLVINPVV